MCNMSSLSQTMARSSFSLTAWSSLIKYLCCSETAQNLVKSLRRERLLSWFTRKYSKRKKPCPRTTNSTRKSSRGGKICEKPASRDMSRICLWFGRAKWDAFATFGWFSSMFVAWSPSLNSSSKRNSGSLNYASQQKLTNFLPVKSMTCEANWSVASVK